MFFQFNRLPVKLTHQFTDKLNKSAANMLARPALDVRADYERSRRNSDPLQKETNIDSILIISFDERWANLLAGQAGILCT
jgi:hypothetical protein